MPYLLLISFFIGGILGGLIQQTRIDKLQDIITISNDRAKQAQERLDQANNKAQELNQQLESYHEEGRKLADSLNQRVIDAGRLLYRCQRSALPKGDDTGSTQEEAKQQELSEGIAQIVREADDVSIYAQTCYQFVIENCGIK